MQKRSPTQLIAYYFLTLGFYEYVWLRRSRELLVKRTALRIPAMSWLYALQVLQLLLVTTAVLLVLAVAGSTNNKPVSQDCWMQHTLEATGQNTQRDLSACDAQIAHYYAVSNRQDKLLKAVAATCGALIITRLGYPRWLRNYGLAAQVYTQGRVSQTTAMMMLTCTPLIGMLYLQQQYDEADSRSLPAGDKNVASYARSQESPAVHRALSIIAIVAGVALGLFVLFWIAVAFYANRG